MKTSHSTDSAWSAVARWWLSTTCAQFLLLLLAYLIWSYKIASLYKHNHILYIIIRLASFQSLHWYPKFKFSNGWTHRRTWPGSSDSTSSNSCGPTCACTARYSNDTTRTTRAASIRSKWCVAKINWRSTLSDCLSLVRSDDTCLILLSAAWGSASARNERLEPRVPVARYALLERQRRNRVWRLRPVRKEPQIH